MSTSLTSLVPVLDGPNFKQWAPLMRSFLMAQGQWVILSRDCPTPDWQAKTVTDEDGTSTTVDDKAEPPVNHEEYDKWQETNAKGLGNILLCCHPEIQYKYGEAKYATVLWRNLDEEYGKPGIIAAYVELRHALDTKVPSDSDPTVALNKITGHFGRVVDAGFDIPQNVQALILLAKLPSYMDSTVQVLTQKVDTDINIKGIRKMLLLGWESRASNRPQQNQGQQANKLSAVKRNPNEPSFQQQQGDGFRGGRGGRGRGRCDRGSRGGQNTRNQQQAQPATQVHKTPQPPTTNAPPDFQFGHITSPAIASFPSISPAAWGEENAFSNSHYPSFNKALALADRIGLKKTTQNIKRLEMASGSLYDVPSDPRPHKKRAGSPWNNLGVVKKRFSSPHPTHDDEVVSLGWSEDEFNTFMEESVNAALNAEASGSGTTHRYVGGFSMSNIANTTHIVTESIINHNAHSALVTCEIESFPATCSSEQDNQRIASWIIDSGASQHFTYDINDFIKYMPFQTPGMVRTANSKAQII